jgi:mutator protein MutT
MDEDQLHAAPRQQLPQEGVPIPVLAAVIRKGERFLVCLRPPHKRHAGYWEFPGGKVEAGETILQAARRELKEELGVEVTSVGSVSFSSQDPGSPFNIQFVEVEITGTPQAIEHDRILWASRQDLLNLRLAPSDRKFVDMLEQQAGSV